MLRGPMLLEVDSVELREPAAGEVLVDVAACGVCGSNLHDWYDPAAALSATREVPGAMGHEIVGRLASNGAPVVVNPAASSACGACPPCGDGAHWFCENPTRIPAYGFSEQMVVPATAVRPLPPSVPLVLGTLVEPLACSVHAVRHSATADAEGRLHGEPVVVIGAGVLGLLAIAAAKAFGSGEITAVARHPHQAEHARALGADTVIGDTDPELVRRLRRVRPPLVIETVGGRAGTFALAAAAVAPRGEVAVVGVFDGTQPLDAQAAVYRETRFFFPVCYAERGGAHDFDLALELIAADADRYAGLVSHRIGLGRINDAFRTAADKTSGAVRVLVEPHAD